MLIRPTDVAAPLPSLDGVTGSTKSMDRDARERSQGGKGHVEGEDKQKKEDAGTKEHIIDESA